MARKNPNAFKKKIRDYKRKIGSAEFTVQISMVFDGDKVLYYGEGRTPQYHQKSSESLKEIYDFFDAKMVDHNAIQWKPFIQITFEGRAFTKEHNSDFRPSAFMRNQLNKVDIQLGTYLIEIGPDANGKLWEREQGADQDRLYPHSKEDGFQPQRWANSGLAGSPKPEHDKEILITTIPDTPENREALRLLIDKFEQLRIKLFEIINPDNIRHTLEKALQSSYLLMTGMDSDQ